MTRRLREFVTCLAIATAVSGCQVTNVRYNAAASGKGSIVNVTPTATRTDQFDPNCNPRDRICLAFLEFDEMGEFWDRGQLSYIHSLLERAKQGPLAPVVVTFTHGWKNNADDNANDAHDVLHGQNGNIIGFEGILEYLKAVYAPRPIVGVFVGWRGDLITKFWPVRRQFSYFNRESAAIRIPGSSMTSALTTIMTDARSNTPDALVIMIGHSFGALVLERALSEAMTDFITRSTAPGGGAGAWADLVVFVNSAAAATEGKQMLDLLKNSPPAAPGKHYTYAWRPADGTAPTHMPLFLSISSLGDAATRFAMPIGHGLPFLGYQFNGSWRTYDSPDPPAITSQHAYYMSTTAHMPALQSHVIVDVISPAGCGAVFRTPITISTGESYQICEKQGRWNTTPYWAMQMPATIVPDHSGFFNMNFVDLLLEFVPPQVGSVVQRPTLKLE